MSHQHMLLMLNDGISNKTPSLVNEVKILQQLLKDWGVLDASEPIDGLFGGNTDKAVKLFQSKRPLTVDGIVGQNTWAALIKVQASEIEIIPRPDEGGVPDTTFPQGQFQDELDEIVSRGYKNIIISSATEFGFSPAIITGLGSRESNWGLALNPQGPTGTGDFGHGRGLMQIDDGAFPDWLATGKWKDAAENIRFGCQVLSDSQNFVESKLGNAGLLTIRATIAGYNAGPGRVVSDVRNGFDPDHTTTGGDYSRDVLNRAGWYQKFADF
jgi:peptidoglycan hydrolase-like protein with peptidoglycan-binding domain